MPARPFTDNAAIYDDINRLIRMTQGTLTWTFAYDNAGNRRQMSSPNGTSTEYAYLDNDWLASVTHKTPGGAILQSFSYSYDPNGNRLSQAGSTTYSYDNNGNLTGMHEQGGHPAFSYHL